MQLFESSDAPYLVPLPAPFGYYNPSSYWQQPALSYWQNQYALIPAAIRAAFEKSYPVSAMQDAGIEGTVPYRLRILLAENWFFGVSIPYAGVYEFPGKIRVKTGVIPAESSHTVIHEFGHHVDMSYHLLWPGTDGIRRSLSSSEPFASLWTAASPNIPSTMYAASNRLEWFAEIWRMQIVNLPG